MSDAKELLRELMDALNDEARARASASVAEDNFTDPSPDEDKLFRATLRAAKAIAAANAFLAQPAASAEDARRYAMLFRNTWRNGKGVGVFSYQGYPASPRRISIQEANEYLDAIGDKHD